MISATTRLTLGLVCLAVSVWLIAYMMGMVPDGRADRLEGRIKLCENVALHCSLLASRNDARTMETALSQLIHRNDEVISAGIRQADDQLLIVAGPHEAEWNLGRHERSTPTQMRVPILAGNVVWGNVELRFREHTEASAWLLQSPLLSLGVFSAAATFLLFFFYLGNILRHLDPTKVIPRRVRQTLNNMAGGLLVLDLNDNILLANSAFADTLGLPVDELTGRKASDLPFDVDADQIAVEGYPWERALREKESQFGDILILKGKGGQPRVLKVSAAPVSGEDGKVRGTMVSFDDVTQLREQQEELRSMLRDLSQSRDEIERQNLELERLAARDALTGCLNRRAFFREFERHWSASERHRYPLSCIMVDLDHFKRINDTYGHQTGDLVLQKTAELLRNARRTTDLVCRYGGEEFCVLLPHTGIEDAGVVAEQIRAAIEGMDFDGFQVTSSLGISARDLGARDPNELIDQADKCLYVAKRNGRNCIVRFDVASKQIAEFEADIEDKPAIALPAVKDDHDPTIPFNAVMALVSALAYRDPMTADHSRRVADLCVIVARRLMSVGESYVLEIAALLHDIGKIGVPDAILLKPGQLTKEEWAVMHSQERIGAEIVRSSFSSPALSEIIRTYRSWFGGNPRHPDLPTGKDIPLAARILAIADAYDSITGRNPYREPMARDQAFLELRRCAIRQFDPELVERFIDVITAQERHRIESCNNVSKAAALSFGTQIEGLAAALDNLDLSGIATLAQRLSLTAVRYDSAKIAEIATQLEAAARDESDVKGLVRLTSELIDLCRSAQRTYLNETMGVTSSVGHRGPAAATREVDSSDA